MESEDRKPARKLSPATMRYRDPDYRTTREWWKGLGKALGFADDYEAFSLPALPVHHRIAGILVWGFVASVAVGVGCIWWAKLS